MNEASRPVAIRVIRPYASEDEYLAKEGDSITKTTIELIGAHSRPLGIILRFEVTLQSGKTLVRGEGRVTQFNANGRYDQPSLSLRFTKLDPKSKALVDRAVLMRQPQQASPAAASDSSRELSDEAGQAPSSAKTAPPPARESRRETEPPPTPIVAQGPGAAFDQDDPDPEGEAVTHAPPAVALMAPLAPIAAIPPVALSEVAPREREPEPEREAKRTSPPPSRMPTPVPPPPASRMPTPVPRSSELESSRPASVPLAAPRTTQTTAPPSSGPITSPSENGRGRRDALLARLRERARALPETRVLEIVRSRARGNA